MSKFYNKSHDGDEFEEPGVVAGTKEAETALVNLAIRDAQCFYRITEAGVRSDFFFRELPGELFNLLEKLTAQSGGTHPGKFEIVSALKRDYAQEHLTAYYEIIGEPIPKESLDRYIRYVINSYKKRQLLALYAELQQITTAAAPTSDAIVAHALNEIEKIDQCTNPLDIMDSPSYALNMRAYFEKADALPRGTLFGIKDLDRYTGGTRLGEFSLLYAPPGKGKSSLYLQAYFYRALVLKRPQLWLSIGDMTAEQDFIRYLQQETGLDPLRLAFGDFKDDWGTDMWPEIDRRLNELSDGMAFMYAASKISTLEVGRIIKKILRQVPTLDVYIDHIGHFSDPAPGIYEKTVLVAQALVGLAHGLVDSEGNRRVSINAISPINKAGNTVGAQELLHAAENILKIDPLPADKGGPDSSKAPDQQSGLVNLLIDKNRNGGSGSVKLFFNAPRAKFEDVDTRHQ